MGRSGDEGGSEPYRRPAEPLSSISPEDTVPDLASTVFATLAELPAELLSEKLDRRVTVWVADTAAAIPDTSTTHT